MSAENMRLGKVFALLQIISTTPLALRLAAALRA